MYVGCNNAACIATNHLIEGKPRAFSGPELLNKYVGENRFLEVTYANGDKEVLYFKDFASGATIESVVRRAKKLALKRYIAGGQKGIMADDLLTAVREEFKENEDHDWAKIAGKKSEQIISVKALTCEVPSQPRSVEHVATTGQYL